MSIAIRPLPKDDLDEADRIFRQAFGTFLGLLPEGVTFMAGAEVVRSRWRADPSSGLAAYLDGELVGSTFATNWGSFGFLGPVSVRPDLWDRGIARRLLEETLALFEGWGIAHAALFTFPQSPRHLGLYQKFGFWPQSLTPVVSKPATGRRETDGWSWFSEVPAAERELCLRRCAELTGAILPGLDLRCEMRSIADARIGETIFLRDGDAVEALAVCHFGAGSEAESGTTYVKFAAVRSGAAALERFDALLSACEALAAAHGSAALVAGVNTARHGAYRRMLERGFRSGLVGVAMQRPNTAGHNRPDYYVIDDWR